MEGKWVIKFTITTELSLCFLPLLPHLSLALALLLSTKCFCAHVAKGLGICGSDLRCNPVHCFYFLCPLHENLLRSSSFHSSVFWQIEFVV
jgi:hypothetical protein